RTATRGSISPTSSWFFETTRQKEVRHDRQSGFHGGGVGARARRPANGGARRRKHDEPWRLPPGLDDRDRLRRGPEGARGERAARRSRRRLAEPRALRLAGGR